MANYNRVMKKERKLTEQFGALAARLRNAQLTLNQLAALQSVQYFDIGCDQRRHANLRTFLIGALVLLLIIACLTLSQVATILIDVWDFQVMIFFYILKFLWNYCLELSMVVGFGCSYT